MTKDSIHLDPKEFAYHFVDSIDRQNIDKGDMKAAAKDQLFAYLTAYVLVEQFNESEASTYLSGNQANIEEMSMGKFLELISQKTDFNAPK